MVPQSQNPHPTPTHPQRLVGWRWGGGGYQLRWLGGDSSVCGVQPVSLRDPGLTNSWIYTSMWHRHCGPSGWVEAWAPRHNSACTKHKQLIYIEPKHPGSMSKEVKKLAKRPLLPYKLLYYKKTPKDVSVVIVFVDVISYTCLHTNGNISLSLK